MEYTVGSIDELYELCKEEEDFDRSIASPLRRFTWRFEELLNRREYFERTGDYVPAKYYYSDSDIRCMDPEKMNSVKLLDDAIWIAKDDLLERFGIQWAEAEADGNDMIGAGESIVDGSDDVIGGFIQLSFDEFSRTA